MVSPWGGGGGGEKEMNNRFSTYRVLVEVSSKIYIKDIRKIVESGQAGF